MPLRRETYLASEKPLGSLLQNAVRSGENSMRLCTCISRTALPAPTGTRDELRGKGRDQHHLNRAWPKGVAVSAAMRTINAAQMSQSGTPAER